MKTTYWNMLLICLVWMPTGNVWATADVGLDQAIKNYKEGPGCNITECCKAANCNAENPEKLIPSYVLQCESEELKKLSNQRLSNTGQILTFGKKKGEYDRTGPELRKQKKCVELANEMVKAHAAVIRGNLGTTKGKSGSTAMDSDEGPKRDCGNYGGLDCKSTENINSTMQAGYQLLDTSGAGAVSLYAADEQSKLAQKGKDATAENAEETRKNIAKAAMRKSGWTATTVGAMAGYQMIRARQHEKSAQDIEDQADSLLADNRVKIQNAEAERTRLVNEETTAKTNCKGDEKCISKVEEAIKTQENIILELNQKNKNIIGNSELEISAQRGAKAESFAASAVTGLMAAQHGFETARLDMVAKSSSLVGSASAPSFSINHNSNGQVIDNPDGQGSKPDVEAAAVKDTEPGANTGNEKFDGGLNDFNPNFNDQSVAGAPPIDGAAVSAPGAQGGGSGAGGAGGTSAARDNGPAGPDGPAGKTQAGKYEGGEGGGSRFSRGGGAATGGKSVGFDGGFADLLKKFLPGAQDERAPAEANTVADAGDDRTPASDRASVISRDKNIFKEISKRYLKKNSEGSVLFQ